MYEYIEVPIGEIAEMLDEYDIEVSSPDGFVPVNYFVDKGMWDEYVLVTKTGEIVRCNENHLFETEKGWMYAKDLVGTKHKYLTIAGYIDGDVFKTGDTIPIVDINVEHENHRYYTNGISSHNTGVGKSLTLCSLAADYIKQGFHVLYFTMEMAETKIAMRVDANILDIDMDDLEKVSESKYMSVFASNVQNKKFGRLKVLEFPNGSAHAGHFMNVLKELQLKEKFIPDIIIVDYLNICASARVKKSGTIMYEYVKSITEELRAMAQKTNTCVVTATQTNKEGNVATDLDISNISESMGAAHTFDFLLGLIVTEELHKMGQILCIQLKNRYSDVFKNKKFTMGCDRPNMRIYDLTNQNTYNSAVTPLQQNTKQNKFAIKTT